VLRRLGKPYMVTLHGGNLPHFARRWPRRVRRLLRSAAAVTTPSPYLLEQMKPYRFDLHLLPNSLNLKEYRFNLRGRPQPRLIWLRAFHKVYNPSLALRVVKTLSERHSDVHLTMVGPDKGDGSLQIVERMAAEMGVTDRIGLPGGVAKLEVPGWLNRNDIFLNTTNVDNRPVSVLEAMACGLCVVSTNVGGIPSLLQHEENALLVPRDDHEAMAGAIERILTEPGLAERLSRNARTDAERYDWSVVLPQWESLIMSLGEGSTG